MKSIYRFSLLIIFSFVTSLTAKAQQKGNNYVQFAKPVLKYVKGALGDIGKCFEKPRWDYYWEMADGTIAINHGVRCYRGDEFVFSSIFDMTSGDCDTQVWQNGQRYKNLCLGNAGGEGQAFVERHGGIKAFYRK